MNYKKTTLPNGLRIITVPAKGNPLVTMMVIVETGSDYEDKRENGLSHFLEHMCFKGTTKRPTSADISIELDSIGADHNASTSNEMTAYYAKASKKHFKKIFDVIADMYLDATLPTKDLERERGVILQEISMYKDLPQSRVWEVLAELMYGDVPAGRTILGTPQNIKRFKRSDFLNYKNKHYVADKTIVVVSGDLAEGEVIKEAKKAFKNIPTSPAPKKPRVIERQKTPALKILKQKTDQTHMILGFRAYNAKDKKIPALDVLTSVLASGMSARLFRKLREEMGACYYIKARHEDMKDYGVLAIYTGINAARAQEVTKVILEECKKLKEELVSEEELNKAKEYRVSHLYMGLETTDSLAWYYGAQEVDTRKPLTPAEEEKLIRKVTAKDIQKIARQLFRNEKLNLAAVGNIKNTAGLKKALKF